MFLSGLEIDFSAFEKGKKKQLLPSGKEAPNTFKTASVIFIAVFILSLGLSYSFVMAGFIDNAFLMTLIISTISLGVVGHAERRASHEDKYRPDYFACRRHCRSCHDDSACSVRLNLRGRKQQYVAADDSYLPPASFYTCSEGYLKSGLLSKCCQKERSRSATRAIFTLIIVLVALSESLGAENILGAFLAGVLVSLLSPNKELVQQLDSFGYGFLIPIFFVMTGVNWTFGHCLAIRKFC
jgi:CPA2 family monovalent cation:H+ antiporter-2